VRLEVSSTHVFEQTRCIVCANVTIAGAYRYTLLHNTLTKEALK
jgi:hypothetical protein